MQFSIGKIEIEKAHGEKKNKNAFSGVILEENKKVFEI